MIFIFWVIVIFILLKIIIEIVNTDIEVSKAQYTKSDAYLDKLDKNIGISTAHCPYCGIELVKFPGRKTKCKNCGSYIYVRTRPYDNVRILIRENQIEAIRDEWAKKNGIYEIILEKRNDYQRIKEKLVKVRGTDNIPENDVNWCLYQEKRLKSARSNNWGAYSFYTEQMAHLLFKEKRYKNALLHYLENAYFELCLCGSADQFSTEKSIKKYSHIARVNYNKISECMEIIHTNINQVKDMFFKMIIIDISYPISRLDAWEIIKTQLNDLL